jgi:hypothetical protein
MKTDQSFDGISLTAHLISLWNIQHLRANWAYEWWLLPSQSVCSYCGMRWLAVQSCQFPLTSVQSHDFIGWWTTQLDQVTKDVGVSRVCLSQLKCQWHAISSHTSLTHWPMINHAFSSTYKTALLTYQCNVVFWRPYDNIK